MGTYMQLNRKRIQATGHPIYDVLMGHSRTVDRETAMEGPLDLLSARDSVQAKLPYFLWNADEDLCILLSP